MYMYTEIISSDSTVLRVGFEKTISPTSNSKYWTITLGKAESISYRVLLYSLHFSHHSMPNHWLVHGHMTSKSETVYRQMP